MTRLSQSVDRVTALLRGADLAADATVRKLLTETTQRRTLDLSDLSPAEQSTLIAARSQELQPSPDALAARIVEADKKDRRFIAKFGIDPTGAEVHLGHAVPMLILSRFQRMGQYRSTPRCCSCVTVGRWSSGTPTIQASSFRHHCATCFDGRSA